MASHWRLTLALLTLLAAFGAPAPAAAQPAAPGPKLPDELRTRLRCESTACKGAMALFAGEDFEAAARAFEPGAPGAGAAELGEMPARLILAARSRELAGQPLRAGMLYLKARPLVDGDGRGGLSDYLGFKAAQTLVEAPGPPASLLARLRDHGVLDHGFAGSALTRARLVARVDAEVPDAAVVAAAAADDEDAACLALSAMAHELRKPEAGADAARLAAFDAALYGQCLDAQLTAPVEPFAKAADDAARVDRSRELYGEVDFKAAHAELEKVDLDGLARPDRCAAYYWLGRTLYRLRDRTAAMDAYQTVVDDCAEPAYEAKRVSAMYAIGKIRFQRDDFDASKQAFEALLADYPDRSHADDALLYLARIAREQSDATAERALVARALSEHPHGDMAHEIGWETTEGLLRAGRYADFIKAVDALALPERDGQYFSQGRLGYFAGLAHKRLKHDDAAAERWQAVWKDYPFSFYGYLARQRLLEMGQTPAGLAADETGGAATGSLGDSGPSPWNALARLALYDMAADVLAAHLAAGTPDRTRLWRLAQLRHRAAQYPISHNIVRRKIDGRPWVDGPGAARTRWEIAWPNPFGALVEAAVDAEAEQSPEADLRPALAVSIMREESSFIEDIESWAGALGLMQLMPRTALGHDDDIDGEATPDKLKTAEVNVRVGVDHLYYLARRFDGHPVLMVAAYNAGSGAVGRFLRASRVDDIGLWVEDIPYDQTRNYTKRVIGSYAAYQWLAGEPLDDRVLRSPK